MSLNELLLSNYIEIGSKVEIFSKEGKVDIQGEYVRSVYHSVIMDLIDEEHIEMLMPMEKTKLVLLQQDSEYELHFITTKGLYQCLARVTRRYKQNQLYMVEMELLSNIQKYQRREYYRYACSLELEVRELTKTEEVLLHEGKRFAPDELPYDKAVTVDISGGGMRFISTFPYEAETYVVCKYTLKRQNGSREYVQFAKILSCKRMEKNQTMYELRIQFYLINNNDREEIIRYIFEEERKRRQRETI